MGGEKKNNLVHFSVSAPGKLILFGEHSVVYGRSALAASISKRTYLNFSEKNSSEKVLTLRMKEIDFNFPIPLKHIKSIVTERIPSYNEEGILVEGMADPKKIDHDEFIIVIENYAKKYFGESFEKMSKQQQMSVKVFLYLLHGLFYDMCITEEHSPFFQPVTVNITSELSVGAGTGSSAAFCVCLAAALFHYKNLKEQGFLSGENSCTFNDQGLKHVLDWAFSGEKILHGKPSGIDNTVATYGSFITLQTTKDSVTNKLLRSFLDLKRPPKIQVLLVDTGVTRDTLRMVEKAAMLKGTHPTVVDLILDAMNFVCDRATEAISKLSAAQMHKDPTTFLFRDLEMLVDMNQGLLYSLGVSHHTLQEICFICSKHGMNAKLTGAGGGGNAFALIPPDFPSCKLAACQEELHRKGYNNDCIQLGSEGVKVEK